MPQQTARCNGVSPVGDLEEVRLKLASLLPRLTRRGISHFLGEIPNVAFFSGMTQSVTKWLTAVRGRHGSCHRKGRASAREHVSPASGLPGGSNRNLRLEICQKKKKYLAKGSFIFFFKDKYATDSVPPRDL